MWYSHLVHAHKRLVNSRLVIVTQFPPVLAADNSEQPKSSWCENMTGTLPADDNTNGSTDAMVTNADDATESSDTEVDLSQDLFPVYVAEMLRLPRTF